VPHRLGGWLRATWAAVCSSYYQSVARTVRRSDEAGAVAVDLRTLRYFSTERPRRLRLIPPPPATTTTAAQPRPCSKSFPSVELPPPRPSPSCDNSPRVMAVRRPFKFAPVRTLRLSWVTRWQRGVLGGCREVLRVSRGRLGGDGRGRVYAGWELSSRRGGLSAGLREGG
jgi:hypothetical protein